MSMRALKPLLNWSADANYYFTDVDYSDYRELICFERPVCFVLHYYFGFRAMRNWLFDRFAFELKNGAFVHRTNALAAFLQSLGIVREAYYRPVDGTLREFLEREVSERNALIVPIETRFGDAVSVTSILVEGIDGSTDRILYTCLRGDDFFVRKEAPLDAISGRISVQDDGSVECHRIAITDELLSLRGFSHGSLWDRHHLSADLLESFRLYYGAQAPNPIGAQLLLSHLESIPTSCEHFAELVGQGFHNVLLAQVFWPMLFAYSPFIVFLRNARRNNLPGDGFLWSNGGAMDGFLKTMLDQSQIVTNLGLMFGRSPRQRELERFLRSLRNLCECYGAIESDFARALSHWITA